MLVLRPPRQLPIYVIPFDLSQLPLALLCYVNLDLPARERIRRSAGNHVCMDADEASVSSFADERALVIHRIGAETGMSYGVRRRRTSVLVNADWHVADADGEFPGLPPTWARFPPARPSPVPAHMPERVRPRANSRLRHSPSRLVHAPPPQFHCRRYFPGQYGLVVALDEVAVEGMAFEGHFPKLDIAGSNPVSRSIFSMTCRMALTLNTV